MMSSPFILKYNVRRKVNQIKYIIQETYIIIQRANTQELNKALVDIKTNRSFTAIFLLTKFCFDRNIQSTIT